MLLIIIRKWGLKKDLETRIDYTLNIEVLISFDANGFKLKRIQNKQNETWGSSLNRNGIECRLFNQL